MSRKNAREDTFRIIFQSLINEKNPKDYLGDYFEIIKTPREAKEPLFLNKPSSGDNEYVETVVAGVLERTAELDALIGNHLVGWDLNRISKVSVAAMRIALYEILYMEDIPTGVAINEAVEFAKKYGGDDCGAFVNGALSSAVKENKGDE